MRRILCQETEGDGAETGGEEDKEENSVEDGADGGVFRGAPIDGCGIQARVKIVGVK